MTLREWWLVFNQRVGEQKWGSLTEDDCASLENTLKQAREKERNG